jgi:Protein kinase domain
MNDDWNQVGYMPVAYLNERNGIQPKPVKSCNSKESSVDKAAHLRKMETQTSTKKIHINTKDHVVTEPNQPNFNRNFSGKYHQLDLEFATDRNNPTLKSNQASSSNSSSQAHPQVPAYPPQYYYQPYSGFPAPTGYPTMFYPPGYPHNQNGVASGYSQQPSQSLQRSVIPQASGVGPQSPGHSQFHGIYPMNQRPTGQPVHPLVYSGNHQGYFVGNQGTMSAHQPLLPMPAPPPGGYPSWPHHSYQPQAYGPGGGYLYHQQPYNYPQGMLPPGYQTAVGPSGSPSSGVSHGNQQGSGGGGHNHLVNMQQSVQGSKSTSQERTMPLDLTDIALPGPLGVGPPNRGSIVVKRKNILNSSTLPMSGLDFEKNRIKKSRFIPKITKSSILDKYSFMNELGRGGFSSVFACFHKELQEQRAVKVIKKKSLHASINYEIELAILQELDHPNIIKIYEVFENDTYIYIVQEYELLLPQTMLWRRAVY